MATFQTLQNYKLALTLVATSPGTHALPYLRLLTQKRFGDFRGVSAVFHSSRPKVLFNRSIGKSTLSKNVGSPGIAP